MPGQSKNMNCPPILPAYNFPPGFNCYKFYFAGSIYLHPRVAVISQILHSVDFGKLLLLYTSIYEMYYEFSFIKVFHLKYLCS